MKYTLTAAFLTFTSSFAIAGNFDCGALSQEQESQVVQHTSAQELQTLAQTCRDQAETFQKLALEAKGTLSNDDVSSLYTKAANAHAHVASFTNESLMK